MEIDKLIGTLKAMRPFVYLATPYTKYHQGLQTAYMEAAQAAALLVRSGVPVFCPITHTHPISVHGKIDPNDHAIWMPADAPFMELAGGLCIFQMPGWNLSKGILIELEAFAARGKPIITPGLSAAGRGIESEMSIKRRATKAAGDKKAYSRHRTAMPSKKSRLPQRLPQEDDQAATAAEELRWPTARGL